MKNKRALWTTLAAFAAILLLIAVVALLVRGGRRGSGGLYPYQWTERRDGSIRLTLDGGPAKAGVWTVNGADDVATVELGETKRGKASATLTPVSEGRAALTFTLRDAESLLAEVRLTVETLQTDGRLALTVLDHSERAGQSPSSGGDAEHPYTAYTDSYGDLVFHIADRDASSADAERWTAASSDELVVSVAEVRAAEDGVDVRLRAHVNGEARVTVSSEAANVTYTLTVTSDSGAPRLRECVWSAYAPPSPLTEEELDALLSGVADSLRNLEIAAQP